MHITPFIITREPLALRRTNSRQYFPHLCTDLDHSKMRNVYEKFHLIKLIEFHELNEGWVLNFLKLNCFSWITDRDDN